MDIGTWIAEVGGPTEAAKLIGVKRTTLTMWRTKKRVPAEHLRVVARVTGIPAHILRPDVVDPPADREAA